MIIGQLKMGVQNKHVSIPHFYGIFLDFLLTCIISTYLRRYIEYKEGAIGFPYTWQLRFWTADKLVSA